MSHLRRIVLSVLVLSAAAVLLDGTTVTASAEQNATQVACCIASA